MELLNKGIYRETLCQRFVPLHALSFFAEMEALN